MKNTILILSLILTLSSCNNQEKIQEKNIDLVNQFFDHFNSHEWQKMAEMYADPAEFLDPSFVREIVSQTHQQTITKYTELNLIFPDIHDEIKTIYPSGENHIIVEFITTGTTQDGSKFTLPVSTIFTLENGKMIKDFTYYDN